jgi:hypothetical protein
MAIDAHDLFFDFAFQYYVAGRTAFFLGLDTVTGNLLHHAIEMSLKGSLSKRGWDLGRLKALGHRLPKMWETFKANSGDGIWSRYDSVVAALSDFEELRYPNSVLKRGMSVSIDLARPTSSLVGKPSASRPEPQYKLYVQDVDELFVSICRGGREFKLFTANEAARHYLKKDNPMATELP